MDHSLFMAVDLGTSFIKAGVYNAEFQCLAAAGAPVPDEQPAAGVFIQRGEKLFEAVMSCIRSTTKQLNDDAKNIEAIAFTGQMAGSMGVDENWNDVTSWSCSLDSRYLPWADRQRADFAGDLFEIGCTNAPVMCSKYAWFRDTFPEEHRRIAKYVMLNGYIIGKLSGIPVSDAKIDNSLITWTGLADVRARRWSEKLCGEMGVNMDHLSEIVDCTTVGGFLSETIAKEVGLRSGIPLVVGAGDKVSGCTGAGILSLGDMIFEAASYGAISCMVPEVRLDGEKRNYDVIGSIDNHSYYAHKYIQGSGISTDWFIETFMRAGGLDKKEALKLAEEEAMRIAPGSDNVLAIGLLGGSAMPFDSELHGLFMGHRWNSTRGHFYRSLMESFSYDLALTLDSIMKAYPEYAGGGIKLIGGGAKSAMWPQMLADVTGHSFTQLDRDDVALCGAAMLAAAGVGKIADIRETAHAHVSDLKTYVPNEANYRIYRPRVEMYESACRELHDLYSRLNQL